MSRLLVGTGFVLFDAAATIFSLLNCSGTLIVLFVSLISSLVVAMTSMVVKSIMFPTYFWDEPLSK
jgi:hypothetical protein